MVTLLGSKVRNGIEEGPLHWARGWGRGTKGEEPRLHVASGVVKQLCLEVEETLSRKWEGSGRPPRAEEQQVPANLRQK